MFMVYAKMSRFLSLVYVAVLLLDNATGENIVQKMIGAVDNAPDLMADQEFDILNPDMDKAIEKLEYMAAVADKLNEPIETDVIPEEDPEKIYDDMIIVLNDITEAVKNSNNAYKFLKANGLDRIVLHNLKVDNDKLKTSILKLLKGLFDVAPTTTSAVIPINIVDRLLDVFEMDNLALKAHSLDVLNYWLPDNPRVQARVMKVRGLATFYEQVTKLDIAVIKTLLDLFNTILKEHLKVRNEVQRNVIDNEKTKFYLRIGLLEHMSTPTVCNGLLNIFVKTWSYSTDENNIISTVFDMLKIIKQFCSKIYSGKAKAKKLFIALQEYVKEPENFEYFESNGLNVTDISLVIEEYVEKSRYSIKDEM